MFREITRLTLVEEEDTKLKKIAYNSLVKDKNIMEKDCAHMETILKELIEQIERLHQGLNSLKKIHPPCAGSRLREGYAHNGFMHVCFVIPKTREYGYKIVYSDKNRGISRETTT